MSHPALAHPSYAPSSFSSRPAGFAPKRQAAPAASPSAASPSSASPYAAQTARYRDAELINATPGQLVVLLYDKTLLTLRRARIACDANQIEVRCEQLLKAADMVAELRDAFAQVVAGGAGAAPTARSA